MQELRYVCWHKLCNVRWVWEKAEETHLWEGKLIRKEYIISLDRKKGGTSKEEKLRLMVTIDYKNNSSLLYNSNHHHNPSLIKQVKFVMFLSSKSTPN